LPEAGSHGTIGPSKQLNAEMENFRSKTAVNTQAEIDSVARSASTNGNATRIAALRTRHSHNLPFLLFDHVVEEKLNLRNLHGELDRAVLDAYGWSDIP
jgi:hypothetical protein